MAIRKVTGKGLADNPAIEGTEGLRVPVGTGLERGAGREGNIRYNSDINNIEVYTGGAWRTMGSENQAIAIAIALG